MSKFFVGQRVRVDCPISEAHGQETTIRALDVVGRWRGQDFLGIQVAIEKKNHRSTFPYFVFECHEIKPILPEGSAPSELTFQQLMDNLQEISAIVRIPDRAAIEADGILSAAWIGGEE